MKLTIHRGSKETGGTGKNNCRRSICSLFLVSQLNLYVLLYFESDSLRKIHLRKCVQIQHCNQTYY